VPGKVPGWVQALEQVLGPGWVLEQVTAPGQVLELVSALGQVLRRLLSRQ